MSVARQILAAVLGLALAGCGDESVDTGAVVTVGAESAVRDAATQVVVLVRGTNSDGADTVERRRTFGGDELSFPLKVGIEPEGGDASRFFGVVAVARDEAGTVLAHASMASSYADGKVAWYHLQLRASCGPSVSCEPLGDGTPTGCCDGACVPVARAPGPQPAWQGEPSSVPERALVCRGDIPPVDGGTDAGTDAGDAGMIEPFGDPASIAAADSFDGLQGGAHSCAISETGRLMCWGRNQEGQLGDGTRADSSRPVDVLLPDGVGATAVALGASHSCALLDDTSVRCWGNNGTGQLGDSGVGASSDEPVEVGDGLSAAAIGAGDSHTCAVLTDGNVECWGRNNRGQIGDGTTTNRPDPTGIAFGAVFAQVCGGSRFTCARTVGGSVWCWGKNSDGQLGDGNGGGLADQSASPVEVTGVSDAEDLDCGSAHACVVQTSGDVMCWGDNDQGQIGDDTTGDRLEPVRVTGLPSEPSPRGVAAGSAHTCLLFDDESVHCWGANLNGQLGDGSITPHHTPARVTGLSGAVAVTTGVNYSCALTGTEAFCWGLNDQGQLGDGTTSGSREPARVVLP